MSVERDDIFPPEEAPDASSKLFREYAAEFVELARNATSADQSFLYLKMANIWQESAIRWERDLLKDQQRLRRDRRAAVSMFYDASHVLPDGDFWEAINSEMNSKHLI